MTKTLHPSHIAAMRVVQQPVDVFVLDTARLLREVEQRRPDLIAIGKPLMTYVGPKPYFSAELTAAGRDFLTKHDKGDQA